MMASPIPHRSARRCCWSLREVHFGFLMRRMIGCLRVSSQFPFAQKFLRRMAQLLPAIARKSAVLARRIDGDSAGTNQESIAVWTWVATDTKDGVTSTCRARYRDWSRRTASRLADGALRPVSTALPAMCTRRFPRNTAGTFGRVIAGSTGPRTTI